MKVFSIIVTHNGMSWIEKCLKSLQKSAIKTEIVVIDNNSSDNTREFINKNFNDILLINEDQNLGFGAANNIGLRLAWQRGADYFFLVNQDVYIHEDTLLKLIDFSNHHPEAGIISPLHLNGDGSDLDFNFKHYLSHGNCPELLPDLYFNRLKDFYEINFANAAAWLITKKCIEKVGGFNPVFHMYGEDDNYIHRLHYHNLKIALLPRAIIFHDREFKGHRKNQEFISKLIDYSHPLQNRSIEQDIKSAKKQVIKNRLLLRLSRATYFKNKVQELQNYPSELSANKKQSLEAGPTFLK